MTYHFYLSTTAKVIVNHPVSFALANVLLYNYRRSFFLCFFRLCPMYHAILYPSIPLFLPLLSVVPSLCEQPSRAILRCSARNAPSLHHRVVFTETRTTKTPSLPPPALGVPPRSSTSLSSSTPCNVASTTLSGIPWLRFFFVILAMVLVPACVGDAGRSFLSKDRSEAYEGIFGRTGKWMKEEWGCQCQREGFFRFLFLFSSGECFRVHLFFFINYTLSDGNRELPQLRMLGFMHEIEKVHLYFSIKRKNYFDSQICDLLFYDCF